MTVVSDIEIRLRADIARLQQDMTRARQEVGGAMDQIKKLAGQAGAALTALGGAAMVAGFGMIIKNAIDAADSLTDLSARTQITVEDLAGLRYGAQMTGTQLEGAAAAISKLALNMGKNSEKYKQLGITATEPLEAFKQLADIFKDIEDPQVRAAFGAEVLGKSWQEAAILLGEGSEGITKLIARGKQLSGVTTETADRAGAFNDKLDEFGAMASGAATRVASQLLPLLVSLQDDILEAGEGAETAGDQFSIITETFRALYLVGGNIAFVFKTVGKEIGGMAAQIEALSRLDFKGFAAIGRDMTADAEASRAAFDQWEQKVLKLGTASDDSAKKAAAASKEQQALAEKAAQAAKEAAERKAKEFLAQEEAQRKATEASRTAQAEREKEKALLYQLAGVNSDYMEQLDRLQRMRVSQNLTTEQYVELVGQLIEKQPGAKAMMDAEEKASQASIQAYERMTESLQKLDAEREDARRNTLEAAQKEAEANEQAVRYFGLTAQAIERLELARLRDQRAQAISNGMTLDDIEDLEKVIALKERSVEAIASKEQLEEAKGFWEEIDKTAHDTFVSIADGGKDLGQRLKDTLKNTFFDWLYKQTLKKWIINIEANGGGLMESVKGLFGPGTIGSSAGSSGAAGGSMLSGGIIGAIVAGMAANNKFYDQGWRMEGQMTDIIKSQFASMFKGNGLAPLTTIMAASAGTFDKLLTSIGVNAKLASMLSGSSTLARAFGRKAPEITAQGIQGTFNASGFSGQAFANVLEKGGWFRSDKRYGKTSALDAAQDAGFDAMIQGMIASVKGFGSALGAQTQSIDSYSKQIKLELTNDAKKNEEIIANLFAEIGDELATRLLPDIAKFWAEGESASDTLQRLALDFQVVDGVLYAFNIASVTAFRAVGTASIEARERLVALSGGIEAMASQTQYFADNFLSRAEQVAPAQRIVTEQLAALGYSGVRTAESFKRAVLGLVESGSLATEQGAKTYAALMQLAPAFKTVTDYLQEVNEAARQTLQQNADTALGVLARSVDAQKTVVQAAYEQAMDSLEMQLDGVNGAIERTSGLSRALRDSVQGINSPQQQVASRQAAQAQVMAAIAIAKAGGVLPSTDDLRDALGVLKADNSNQFSSFVDYQREVARTNAQLIELGAITDDQLSAAERQLRALQDQRDSMKSGFEDEVRRLDGLLLSAQLQLDAVNGVNNSVLSVEAAVNAATAAIEALKTPANSSGLPLTSYSPTMAGPVSTAIPVVNYTSASGTITPSAAAMQRTLESLDTRMANMEISAARTANSTSQTAQQIDQLSGGGNALLVATA